MRCLRIKHLRKQCRRRAARRRFPQVRALDANMLTPIDLIKSTINGMIARKFGRIVNITSQAVKAPIGFHGLSNGVRAGLGAPSPSTT